MGILDFLKFFKPKPKVSPPPAEEVVRIPGTGRFDCDVVGESHYQDNLKTIAGQHDDKGSKLETDARLILDDKNPHDSQAVRVEINGLVVGYLSRPMARAYRQGLREQKRPNVTATCTARIRGGGIKRGERLNYGVYLDIPVEVE